MSGSVNESVNESVSELGCGSPGIRPRVAVVGAGIAGLTAARQLALDGVDVVVVEASSRTGGKLLRGEVAGVSTDLGAEALLARRPEALALIDEVGLSGEVVHPETTQASIWSRGALRALPAGHVMGVPTDLRALAASGVVSRRAVARAALDLVLPGSPLDDDTSVRGFVAARLGRAVVDRLVEPLLGGVYAGRAEELSLRATLPAVAAMAGHGSLLRALRGRRPTAVNGGPVFAGLPGGVGRLAEELSASVVSLGADLRLQATVRDLQRSPSGWRLVLGSTADPQVLEADAVVLAVPAAPAARLLRGCLPAAAAELTGIEYASMAVVTLAFAASAVSFSGSGFLVPAVAHRLVKAATFSSSKWGWYPADLTVVRCSVGRYGDAAQLQRDDAELVAGARADLAAVAGVTAAPVDALVTRWGGALPQYAVGHLERVARISAALQAARAGGAALAVCGAAYDGVGIPACIAGGRLAATQVLQALRREGQ